MSFDPDLYTKHAAPGKSHKENAPYHPYNKAYKGRKIRSLGENHTPSMANITNINEGVREHGARRVEVFDYFISKIHGLAVRSDGSALNVQGFVEGAYLQQGKGSREKGTHAAHVYPLAGFRDNLKEVAIDQMVNEQEITPKKQKYLKMVGATAAEIQDIYDHIHDKEYVVRKIAEIAPGPSAFSNSNVEETLNTTNELPFEVNLQIDCALERQIRPQVAALTIKAMKNEVSRLQARDEFVELVVNGLKTICRRLKAQVKLEYSLESDFSKTQKTLSYARLELQGTRQAFKILNSRPD